MAQGVRGRSRSSARDSRAIRPRRILDRLAGAASRRGIRPAHGEDPVMVPAMAGDLVAGLGDPADQRGIAPATQPKVKKVALTPASSNRASTASALRSTRRGSVSQSRGDHLLEGADLEPVLDIDREGVEHRLASADLRRRWCARRPSGRSSTQSTSRVKTRRTRLLLVDARLQRGDALRRACGSRTVRRRRGSAARPRATDRAERSGSTVRGRRARRARRRRPGRRRRFDRLGASIVSALLDRGEEQQAAGQLVDPARNAAGMAVERGEGVRRRRRDCPPADAGRRWTI